MAETPTQIEPAAGGSLLAVEGDGTKRESGKTNARNAGGGNVGGGNGGGGGDNGGGGDGQNWLGPAKGIFQAIGSAGVGLAGLAIAGAIIWGLFQPDSIVRQLGNADVARGAITFVFAVGTIGIALLICLGALIGDHADWQIVRAREVLTVLIGVFGTILGFYFGAAGGNSQKLELADIRITDKLLTTHVAGGTAPYRYSITSSEKDFKPVKNQISTDGWIVQQLESVPTTGKITVEVIDSRDLKASRDRPLSTDAAASSPTPAASASPRPGAPTPTPTPSPSPRPTPSATP